ncbi:71 kDa [Pelobates cultripes]|uniref:71 kDa n=1 Tax=Pelobates cultripes TaxID=61616 RepID=A0AAD1QYU4_PELCU|nr:71 kDa [Pelobates cultripes]
MEYQTQSKAALDQLCRERSIPCRGKTKEELLQALVDYDMQQAVQNDASNTAGEIPAAFVRDVPSSGDPLDCYLQTVLKYVDSADANQRLQLILQYQETAERQAEREAAERQAAREHELKMAELERLTASPVTGKLADVHTANRATVDRSRGFAKGASSWRTTPP